MAQIKLKYNSRNIKALKLVDFLRTLDFIKIDEDSDAKADNKRNATIAKKKVSAKRKTVKISNYMELVEDPFNLQS